MGAITEQNLGGASSFDTLSTKVLELLDRWAASKKQPQAERKSESGKTESAATQPSTSTGGMTMTQVAAEAQREERGRVSKIYKAGRAVGCSTDFLGKLVEQEISLGQAYEAIINHVDEKKGKAQKASNEPAASVAPGSPEEAESIARQEWSKSSALQAEFPRFSSYAAFKRHEPNIKILGGKVVKGSRSTK